MANRGLPHRKTIGGASAGCVAPLQLISGRNIAHRSKLPSRNAGLALPFWEQ
jgi:hypothetical protein